MNSKPQCIRDIILEVYEIHRLKHELQNPRMYKLQNPRMYKLQNPRMYKFQTSDCKNIIDFEQYNFPARCLNYKVTLQYERVCK